MVILGLKMAILDLEMAMEISEHTFIWSAAKSCTLESGIIHFNILFYTFLSMKCQKGLKMAILGLAMAILDLKTAMDLSKNIFIWLAAKICTMESWIIHFWYIFLYFPVSEMSKGPKNGHFGLKMAILDLKTAMDLSKNIFILSAAKSCTIESGIINFIILFYTFLSLKCQMA